jgi:predicted transcriptional regulator
MSPRAAWRLESLGLIAVYDYVAGKADWGAAGLPLEGAAGPWVGELARHEVPTCGLDEPLSSVRERVRQSGFETCIVVNEHGVVLGRLGRRALAGEDEAPVEDAMASGPGTVRPDLPVAEAVRRMRERDLSSLLVTRSDGTLIGLVRRGEAAGSDPGSDSTAQP